MKNIGFICTGNTCRSPMAEGYFRHLVQGEEVSVFSAGVGTVNGMVVAQNAVQTMQYKGVDISDHASRVLDDALIEQADMLLPMTSMHRSLMLDRWPHKKDAIFLLREFAAKPDPSDMDIFDPVGCPLEVYQKCFDLMQEPLERLKEIICKK